MKKTCVALTVILLILVLALAPTAYSWFLNTLNMQPDMTSHVHKSYFQSGDGETAEQFIDGLHATEENCAFEIKYPIQLYYFAWLQALGYFNGPNDAETGIHQYYFYLSEDLDMTGWVLPPVGTQQYPFVGNFNGNGHTISNLTIQNVDTSGGTSLTDIPDDDLSGMNIVGFFGVVGELGNTGSVNGYTYSSAVNVIQNFTLDNVTIKTDTTNSLIGAIAGYVNGTVSNAAVSAADIVVKSGTTVLGGDMTNISDYSLVGYCTDEYKYTLNVSKVTAHAPEETQNIIYKNIQGEGAGFGGSIKMQQLYNRLTTIRSSIGGPGTTSTYNTAETVIYDEATGETSAPFDVTTASVAFRQRTYNSPAGSYSFSRYSSTAEGSGSNTSIVYLYGRDDASYVTNRTTITKKNQYENGNLISQNGTYLNINANNNGIASGTDPDAATGWVTDNGGHLYTYGSDGRIYYLNGTTTLAVSTTQSTVWTWDNETGRYSYTLNGMTYYLQYSGGWTVIPGYYYLIGDGKGNYLNFNGSLGNTTNADSASHWTFSSMGNNPSGYISTVYNNTTYYLRYNNGFTTYNGNNYATNATNWTNNGTSLYNGTHYIRFNGIEWTAENRETFYTIHDGANYLNITSANGTTATLGTGAGATYYTDANGNTLWSFSTTGNNPSGTISAVVNGVTYYLNDNNGALTATTAASTSWGNDGTSIYLGNECLTYDNGWKLVEVNTLAIKSGNYYLNITNANNATTATLGTGNSVATGSVSNHTVWNFSDSGQIYAVANGRTYYLRNNNGTLQATTTDFTGWTVNGGMVSNGDYYLNYSNGWRISTPDLLGYTIDYNGNYLNLTSTNTGTNNPIGTGTNVADLAVDGHTVWTFATNGTYPSGRMSVKINGTTYYLYDNSNNTANRLRITTSNTTSNNNGTWTNTNGRLQVRNKNLRYQNGWQHSNTNSNNILNFTPIYGDAPTVSFEAGGGPSVSATSATEPANTQPIRVDVPITGLTRTQASVRVLTRTTSTVPAEYPADTYIPLNCVGGTWNAENSSIEASDDNTGYIVSGADYHNDNFPDRSGDIRVSEYNMSYITNAVNGNGTGSNFTYNASYDARLEVITAVSYNTYSGFYRVSDSYNAENASINSNISNAVANSRKISYVDLGFKRYKDARDAISETFLNTNKIYGLHFMNAEIDKDDCAVVPQAIINGEEIANLTVPRNSIDFFVKRRGFITVFAGTYFTGNEAFFSLHEITRYTEDDPEVINGTKQVRDIKEIKEISKVYRAAVGRDFIFQYADGTYSSNAARDSLAFDLAWMTNPSTFVNNAVYYFEIPVNGGEYCLGSVTGKQGAYLFYLDIAANAALAEDKDRVTVTEQFREENYSVELPRGVQIVESGSTYDSTSPYELATVELKSGYSGTYSLVREGNNFYYTSGANNELTYIGGELNAKTRSGQDVSDYVYYPNGYVIRYLEHSVDVGRDTGNADYMLVETTDTYDTGGTRTGRTVTVYADIDNSGETNEANLDEIITFTYNPTGHDSMTTRIVRASSEGGFNISFNEDVSILSATIPSEEVHVNFGDQYASVLMTITQATPIISATNVLAVDMSGNGEIEDTFYPYAYGPELATYVNYYEGASATVTRSTSWTMPTLDYGNAAQNRTLTYAITLTPGGGASQVSVYGKKLIPSTYTYTTKVLEDEDATDIVTSGTITVTVNAVTINSTALGSDVAEITIN